MQVLNIRNVSAPKANQESKTSPRLLQIDLTDGQTLCSGLEMDNIPALSINVAPGTKVMLKNPLKLIQGMLSLNAQNISVIGGQVASLYEKWDINRTLAKYAQGARRPATGDDGNGPPPWIPFGQKLAQSANHDKSFKSLGAVTGDKSKEPSKENSEFIASRNEAIAEATKLGTKKVFGGGNRQLMDHNVKKIMDKGYTEEQAKYALKVARNNLERAMSSLKRRNAGDDDKKGADTSKLRASYQSEEKYRGGPSSGRRGKNDAADAVIASKPSGISLFDFLKNEIKIPATAEQPTTTQSSAPSKPPSGKPSSNTSSNSNYRNQQQSNPRYQSRHENQSNPHHVSDNNRSKFENNISSSFASRQKKDEDVPSHSKNNNNNNNNYNSSRSNNPKWNDGPHANNYVNKNAKSSFPPYSQQQQHLPQQSNYNQSRQNSTNNSKHNNNNSSNNNSDNHKYQSNNPKYHNNNNNSNNINNNNSNNSQSHHQQNNSNYYNSGGNYQSNNNSTRYNSSKNQSSGTDNHQYSDMVSSKLYT